MVSGPSLSHRKSSRSPSASAIVSHSLHSFRGAKKALYRGSVHCGMVFSDVSHRHSVCLSGIIVGLFKGDTEPGHAKSHVVPTTLRMKETLHHIIQ